MPLCSVNLALGGHASRAPKPALRGESTTRQGLSQPGRSGLRTRARAASAPCRPPSAAPSRGSRVVMAASARKPVLLGLRDAPVQDCPRGPSDWTTSRLGGVPDALPAVAAPEPRCDSCAYPLALVVQVYCPLEGSPFHRLIHVFACARPGCGNRGTRCWKVLRSQCLQVPEKETQNGQEQGQGLAAETWCEGSQDWGNDSKEAPPPPPPSDLGTDCNSVRTGDWAAQLQALHLQDTDPAVASPSPAAPGLPAPTEGPGLPAPTEVPVPQFQPYYICVANEDDYRKPAGLDHAQSLLQDYKQREGVDLEHLLSLCSAGDGDEKYEKTNIRGGDQTFYKFMKKIAACQEQILRYSWSGEPLFFTCPTLEVSEIPACSGCGGHRTFEFQLMPALVSMLSSADLRKCTVWN
ncbi:programmed cell death protein 2-like isoform X9 [Cricetulus griseus]|uniref:Programmed cell death protein 2-like isoform X9 n=1 Tax=Cricetulus griseus TaxID=10029 RepID=A0A9J7GGY3_CRIGR|nr:programmed cell death protein 2-like isoform X9 [Cricetulus griseus]